MIKPANISDSEPVEENEISSLVVQEKKTDEKKDDDLKIEIKDKLTSKEKIDQIYEKQIKEFGGEDKLIYINDQNVVRALFVYDDFFF